MMDKFLEELGYSSRAEFRRAMLKYACEGLALIALAVGVFAVASIFGAH